jgi:hypothetical protein
MASPLHKVRSCMEVRALIRISQISKDPTWHLLVEGTLSDGWVDALEVSWLEAQPNGGPVRIDLAGVTYIDDKGRELLARMIRRGAELCATGIMTKAVIEEITEEIKSEHQVGIQAEAAEFTMEQTADDGDKINAGKLRTHQRTPESRN